MSRCLEAASAYEGGVVVVLVFQKLKFEDGAVAACSMRLIDLAS